MAKKNGTRVQDIIGIVNGICPPSLAEEWDNVGLQVGDPDAEVTRIAIALDPTEATLDGAISAGAELLLCHHPLIFKPLRQVAPVDATGRIVFKALRQGVAIVSAHTNLDRAKNGLNDWLADRLGIENPVPLETPDGLLFKLAVFVPKEHEVKVSEAIFAAGGGQVGGYDHCSFRTDGSGTFRPGMGADPFIGSVGKDEMVDEVRIETIVAKEKLGRVVARMLKAHPYEEVAYDIYPLLNSRSDVGLGRIGRLKEKTTLSDYARVVRQALGADHVRLSGDPEREVKKVAVCGGSGASLLSAAGRQGADLLVTGDVKYHDTQIAASLDVALIDAGHFATERIMIDGLAGYLRQLLEERNVEAEILALDCERDPFAII